MVTYYSFSLPSQGDGPPLPVDVLSCGCGRETSPSYSWDNERHQRYATQAGEECIVQWTLEGFGYFQNRVAAPSATFTVGPGQSFVAAGNRPYSYFLGDSPLWVFYWMSLVGPAADQLLAPWKTAEAQPFSLAETGPALLTLKALLAELQNGSRPDRWRLSTIGYTFLTELRSERERETQQPALRIRDEAVRFITADLAGACVESLAAHFGYHPKYFNDYLRRATGLTPHRFIQQVRMEQAKALLVKTGWSVVEVARQCGFSDPAHFSRLFKAFSGCSPRSYFRQ